MSMANLEPVTRRMLDLSTAHITKRDTELFAWVNNQPIRVVSHEYGWLVFLPSDDLTDHFEAINEAGYSEAFRAIYEAASKMGGDLMLINFDQDAEQVDGLPTFDW